MNDEQSRRAAKQPEVEIAALCDVYQPNLDQALKATNGKAKKEKPQSL